MSTSPKNLIITGAGGMLGNWMQKVFEKDKRYTVIALKGKAELNFLDFEALQNYLLPRKPYDVIHCAAITNLEECESHPQKAFDVHVIATAMLAKHCERMIFISTDSVFDGVTGNYSEGDSPNPLNVYAQTKMQGEQAALQNCDHAIVLRTNIYGKGSGNSLVDWAIGEWMQDKVIKGFTDVIFNPLHVRQVAEAAAKLLDSKANGIYHLSGKESLSKFEFLKRVATQLGFPEEWVTEGKLADLHASIERPLNTTLNCDEITKILGTIPEIAKGLQYLQEEYGKIH